MADDITVHTPDELPELTPEVASTLLDILQDLYEKQKDAEPGD